MITETHELIPGEAASGLLFVADHASRDVPEGVDLGICATVLDRHVAIDIGVDPLTRLLAERFAAPGIVARISRLVIDLNREEDAHGLIPHASDGIDIPGNRALAEHQREARVARYHRAYHAAIEALIVANRPRLLVSVHSFTPALESRPEEARPWQIGILYNGDDRAARIAIPLLRDAGWAVGDNQPYSGKVLNYTMNRHAEANGIPYLGLEIRQDQLATHGGVADWANRLAPVIGKARDAFS